MISICCSCISKDGSFFIRQIYKKNNYTTPSSRAHSRTKQPLSELRSVLFGTTLPSLLLSEGNQAGTEQVEARAQQHKIKQPVYVSGCYKKYLCKALLKQTISLPNNSPLPANMDFDRLANRYTYHLPVM